MWWKKNKRRVLAPALIAAVLAAAFYFGGSAPGLQGWSVKNGTQSGSASSAAVSSESVSSASSSAASSSSPAASASASSAASSEAQADASAAAGKKAQTPAGKKTAADKTAKKTGAGSNSRPGGTEGGMTASEKETAAAKLAAQTGAASGTQKGDKSYSEQNGMKIDAKTGKDKYQTDPVPEGKPVPVEPQDAVITDKACTCTISISCAAILDNMDWLDDDKKKELVPEDGVILKPTQVTFYEGESAFNVLLRTCKQNKIHMEYENTPIYNSAYIEGIHNLYEFDCGELSGWMYQVNDWFPNYGCSRYALRDGDTVNWVYTCNLGYDVGGGSSAGG